MRVSLTRGPNNLHVVAPVSYIGDVLCSPNKHVIIVTSPE